MVLSKTVNWLVESLSRRKVRCLYKLSKSNCAMQLFAYYSKDMHIHTAACATAGIIPHPDAPTLHRFPPKWHVKMQLLAPCPKPSSLATGWGEGGASCGVAALDCGWQTPIQKTNLLGSRAQALRSPTQRVNNQVRCPCKEQPQNPMVFPAGSTTRGQQQTHT